MKKFPFILKLSLLFIFFLGIGSRVHAAANLPGVASELLSQNTSSDTSSEDPDVESKGPTLVTKLAVLAGLALLPFAIMLLTSFLKIVIVLSLLRNALGVQQSPPNQAINGIALLMTVYVMFPTCLNMYNSAQEYIKKDPPKDLFSSESAYYLVNVLDKAKEPMRQFLQNNTISNHMKHFYQLAYRSFPKEFRSELKMSDFIILIPAYITSQLKGAFEIGVLIYLPFFVIDLVTSNILLAMGMMMLSPLTIALPLKLLLIVMVDGWTLVIQGLVMTYR